MKVLGFLLFSLACCQSRERIKKCFYDLERRIDDVYTFNREKYKRMHLYRDRVLENGEFFYKTLSLCEGIKETEWFNLE